MDVTGSFLCGKVSGESLVFWLCHSELGVDICRLRESQNIQEEMKFHHHLYSLRQPGVLCAVQPALTRCACVSCAVQPALIRCAGVRNAVQPVANQVCRYVFCCTACGNQVCRCAVCCIACANQVFRCAVRCTACTNQVCGVLAQGQVFMLLLKTDLHRQPPVALSLGRMPTRLKRNSPKAAFVSQRFVQCCHREAEKQS